MRMTRRRLLGGTIGGAALVGAGAAAWTNRPANTVRLLFTNDLHSHLRPIYHRDYYDEADLRANGITARSPEAYISSFVGFEDLAKRYGKVGGLAQLATVITRERDPFPDRTLLLDAGDTWYGSAIGLLTDGRACVQVMNAIGYDAMTLHWEFNFGKEILLARVKEAKFAVLAQNVTDDFDERVFKPSLVRDLGDTRVGVIGQAYPFSMLTTELRDNNPDLHAGYAVEALTKEVARLRNAEGVKIVVLLSHMGPDQEQAIALRVPGIDVVVGGHTHEILWRPVRAGNTVIVQAGSHGKLLGELDLVIRDGRVDGFQYRLLPILADRIEPEPRIKALIDELYRPHEARLARVIGESRSVLYRRSLYGGTTDAFMASAYREITGAQIGCCPGWRFGSTVLPGPVRVEDVYSAMKPTPSPLYRVRLSARIIRAVIEDNLDNVFNPDPLERLGGEVIRCLGVSGTVHPDRVRGSRLQEMRVNDQAAEGDFVIATSGGRTQYRDPDATASARPAVEELVAYIEAHPVLAADPLRGLTEK